MNEASSAQVHELLDEFVQSIDRDDRRVLQRKFDVSETVAEEIRESIYGYYPAGNFSLGIAPLELAFSKGKDGRPNIEFFRMLDEISWGAECVIWNKGEPGEAILHVDFVCEKRELKLRYRNIDS